MRFILNIATATLLLVMMVDGFEVLDSTLANLPTREVTPESANTNEEAVHFFHSDQKISKQANQYSNSVDKSILLLPSSYAFQPIVPKKGCYILHGALLV